MITQAQLNELLDQDAPDLTERLVAMMEWRAVLILDMTGFSSLTRDEGVVEALKRIRAFQLYSTGCVLDWGGQVIKCYADNVMATFPSLEQARLAAIAATTFGDASGGIECGYVLPIMGDLYGHAVNVASRLGEDEAGAGEVLEAPETNA